MDGGMTDRDNHAFELINAEIDGVMTGAQRAELNRLLLADPAVRALRDETTQLCRALDTTPREELPVGLHDAIVTGLPLAPGAMRLSARRHFSQQPLLRYAAAFVGGALVSTLAFQLGKFDAAQLGQGDLAGTIAAQTHVDAVQAEARMIVNLPQAQGSITLSGSADDPQVVTSLATTQPVSIVTRLHGNGVVDVQVVDDATSSVLQRGKLRIGSDR
jgi:anti-sigma factor RsiW